MKRRSLSMNRRTGWSLAGIIATLGSLLVAGLQGVLGNRLDKLIDWLQKNLPKLLEMDLWAWIIVLVAFLVCLGTTFYSWRHSKVLNRALATSHNMLELDDSLLRLLASWIPAKDHETEMKKLLAGLLHNASVEFDGEVHRASILLPNANNEYLEIWTNYGMPQESVRQTKFYIGSDDSKWPDRGVAGQVFLKGELRVGHLMRDKGILRSDCDGFKRFNNRTPPYRSFITVPIIGVEPNSTGKFATLCLGVVCFDSMNLTIFDNLASQEVLRVFARRIAASLLIYQQLP